MKDPTPWVAENGARFDCDYTNGLGYFPRTGMRLWYEPRPEYDDEEEQP